MNLPFFLLLLISAWTVQAVKCSAASASTAHLFGPVSLLRVNPDRTTRGLIKLSDGRWLEFGTVQLPTTSTSKQPSYKWYADALDKSFQSVGEYVDNRTNNTFAMAVVPGSDSSIVIVGKGNGAAPTGNSSTGQSPQSSLVIESFTAGKDISPVFSLPCEARDFFLHGLIRAQNSSIALYGMSSTLGTFLSQNQGRQGISGFVYSINLTNSNTWTHLFNDGERSYVSSAVLLRDGRLAVAGGVVTKVASPAKQGFSPNSSYGLLRFLNSDGVTTIERKFTSTKSASVGRIVEVSSGGLVVAGSYVGELQFGKYTATNQSAGGTFYVGLVSLNDELKWLSAATGGHASILKIVPLERGHFLLMLEHNWTSDAVIFQDNNLRAVGEKNLTVMLMNEAGDFLGSKRIAGVVRGDLSSRSLSAAYDNGSKDIIIVFSAKGEVSLGEPTKSLGRFDQFHQFAAKCAVQF